MEAWSHVGKGKYIFYGGARGGGKSHLARVAAVLAANQYPGLRVVCVRTTYPELYEVFISRILEDYPPESWGYVYRARERVMLFDNGSRVFFRPIDSEVALKKVLGLEYQFIILDEANLLPENYIHRLRGSLRRPVSGFFPTMLMTGNPGGVSDAYFKTRFVAPDYRYWSKHELREADKFVFVPAKVYDNPYVGEDYIQRLEGMSPELRRMWLEGDWSVISGRFFTSWMPEVHVIEPFDIPSNWLVVVGLDLGRGSHPSAAVWCAQHPDTGCVYVFDELVSYSTLEDLVEEFARVEDGHLAKLNVIYADPSMWVKAHERRDELAPATVFGMRYPILPANNDRVNGWRILKMWLNWSETQPPGLYVFSNCTELIRTIPLQQYAYSRDGTKEDLDTRKEDDLVDALRYAIASGFPLPSYIARGEPGSNAQVSREEKPPERLPEDVPEHVLFY